MCDLGNETRRRRAPPQFRCAQRPRTVCRDHVRALLPPNVSVHVLVYVEYLFRRRRIICLALALILYFSSPRNRLRPKNARAHSETCRDFESDAMQIAALRVLTLTTLLAVRAQTLSNGVDGHYGATGGERYTKLDRFLHDRMGLGGNRSEQPTLTTDRWGLLSRMTTAASVAVPEDEDDGGDDEGGDDDDDDEDEDENENEEDEEDEELTRKAIRLRHWNRWEEENALFDKVIIFRHSIHRS